MNKTVPERLAELGEIFKERNQLYGSNYRLFGGVLNAMFPDGIEVYGPYDLNRLMLFLQVVHKLTRYARALTDGGHKDSADDACVYLQMMRELDDEYAGVHLRSGDDELDIESDYDGGETAGDSRMVWVPHQSGDRTYFKRTPTVAPSDPTDIGEVDKKDGPHGLYGARLAEVLRRGKRLSKRLGSKPTRDRPQRKLRQGSARRRVRKNR